MHAVPSLRAMVLLALAGAVLAGATVPSECSAQPYAGPQWYVAPDGDDAADGSVANPLATIQTAVDRATDGHEILLLDGLFHGNGNREITFQGKTLAVRPLNGDPARCVVDGGGQVGFRLDAQEPAGATLENLSVRNCSVGIVVGDPAGGASASPTIVGCVVSQGGTGILVAGTGSAPTLTSCQLTANDVGLAFAAGAQGAVVSACTVSANVLQGIATSGATTFADAPLILSACEVRGNGGTGVLYAEGYAGLQLVDTQIFGNGGWGVEYNSSGAGGLAIAGGRIADNGSGGLTTGIAYQLTVSDCEIADNLGPGLLAAGSAYSVELTRTRIVGNNGDGVARSGDLLQQQRAQLATAIGLFASECEISANAGSGLVHGKGLLGDVVELDHCVVWGNAAAGLVLGGSSGPIAEYRLLNTTVAHNGGAGLVFDTDAATTIQNSLIAYNTGVAVDCQVAGTPALSCVNIFGNALGDWTGGIEVQENVDGNSARIPLFCDAAAGDYQLQANSPLALANNTPCGTVGAFDLGCEAPLSTCRDLQVYDPETGVADSTLWDIEVSVEGVVFVAPGTYRWGGGGWVVDETGGINFWSEDGGLTLAPGDRARVTGQVWPGGDGEMFLGRSVQVLLATGEEPEPVLHSPTSLAADYGNTGVFVQVVGVVDSLTTDRFLLRDAESSLEIRRVDFTGVSFAGLSDGEPWVVAGPAMRDGPAFYVVPRAQGDLVPAASFWPDRSLYHVDPAGSDLAEGGPGDPLATIGEAVLRTTDGDTIQLADGTYAGPGNRNITYADKMIRIASASGDPEACVWDLEGEDGLNCLNSGGGADAGFSLKGLSVVNGDVGVAVAGHYWEFYGSYDVEDCHFAGNRIGLNAEWARGSIRTSRFRDNDEYGCNVDGADCDVVDCVFEENGTGLFLYCLWYSQLDDTRFVRNGTGVEFWPMGKKLPAVQALADPSINLQVDFNACELDSNVTDGIVCGGACSGGVVFNGGSVSYNGQRGVRTVNDLSYFRMYGVEVIGNGADGVRVESICGGFTLTDMIISDNGGAGLYVVGSWITSPMRILRSDIFRNAGGGIYSEHAANVIEDCVITDNGAFGLWFGPTSSEADTTVTLIRSTVANNSGTALVSTRNLAVLDHSIVAFNTGEALDQTQASTYHLACCDLFGNAGGDWVGAIAGQLMSDGNLSVDPGFCAGDNADDPYGLGSDSPCAANLSGCGRVGARDVTCDAHPVILSVTDVGEDQGGQVRLVWVRSGYDTPGSSTPITGYDVYRAQADTAGLKAARRDGDKLSGWDFVATVPARADSIYQYVAATLCDSTIVGGLCLSTFMVSATTDDPTVYFDSQPRAGYSIDNLSPDAPGSLQVVYAAQANDLAWAPPADDDVSHFLIWRTAVADSAPDFTTLPVATTPEPAWRDALAVGDNAWTYRYWVVAVDYAGNRGDAAGQSNPLAGVPGFASRTALYAAAPNPFNPRTVITFDLGTTETVHLDIFDLGGRLIASPVAAEVRQPGRYEVHWNGQDRFGRQAAAGVYLYRLRAGAFAETRRMVLVK